VNKTLKHGTILPNFAGYHAFSLPAHRVRRRPEIWARVVDVTPLSNQAQAYDIARLFGEGKGRRQGGISGNLCCPRFNLKL